MNKPLELESKDSLFRDHIENEKIRVSRIMGVLSALLIILFSIADFFSVSASLNEVLLIRGGVLVPVLFFYSLTFTDYFIRFYTYIVSLVYLSTASGINAMIYLALPEDHASNVYFAGLLLVIMTIFAWSYFKVAISLTLTAIIIASFSYVEIGKGMETSALLVNIFFLLSGASIGFFSQLLRDRYLRENFVLQQSLKEALEAKTEEAKDFAYKANHDELTGLPNRRFATSLLEESLEIAKRKDRVLVIMFVDLNGFKQINDVYGHSVGDDVLTIVAKRLELAVRKSDCLSRIGGDEFLIGLLLDKENVSEVEHMAEKFSTIISEPMGIDDMRLTVGASVGISAYPYHGNKVGVLMDIADQKMYKIKHGIDDQAESFNNEPVVIFPGKSAKNK